MCFQHFLIWILLTSYLLVCIFEYNLFGMVTLIKPGLNLTEILFSKIISVFNLIEIEIEFCWKRLVLISCYPQSITIQWLPSF